MAADRIDWIFDSEADSSIAERYDAWAETYDEDHDEWGWRGPDVVAQAAMRHIQVNDRASMIVDAGCGTGKAGIALRNAGWAGKIVGLDVSQGMLDRAASFGVYDDLIRCSLYDIPINAVDGAGAVVAVVSSGVFTHGHVSGVALGELCRVTASGGVIAMTQRLDLADAFAPHVEELRRSGRWHEVERTEPEQLHPGRNDTEQVVFAWRTGPPDHPDES